jgi:paraquat-inducible protein A
MPLVTRLKAAWFVVSAMLVAGSVLPMFTFSQFYIFNDTFSLASGIFYLLKEGEPLLFVVVFSFSILMPVWKMVLLYRLLHLSDRDMERCQRQLHVLSFLGKWSMLDVFVVAILVVTVKLGAIANVTVHVGIYLFTVAVLASMLLTHWITLALQANADVDTNP